MTTSIIVILLVVVGVRIFNIRKNKGETNIQTELLYGGTHFIFSVVFLIIQKMLF
jgi:hypothetical protein